MANIKEIKEKQNEKLTGGSDQEKALAAARRVMEEMRRKHHIQEPNQLASGKSDENGEMVTEDIKPDEDIDISQDESVESSK